MGLSGLTLQGRRQEEKGREGQDTREQALVCPRVCYVCSDWGAGDGQVWGLILGGLHWRLYRGGSIGAPVGAQRDAQ